MSYAVLHASLLLPRASAAAVAGGRRMTAAGADGRTMLRRDVRPWVGFVSVGNTVAVRRYGDRVVCRLTPGTVALLALGLLIFGPGISALLWYRQGTLPWLLWVAILVLNAAAWWGFLRALLRQGSADIRFSSSELRLYRGWLFEPDRIVRRDQIGAVTIKEAWFRNEAGATKNSVLWLSLHGGEQLALCASPNAAVIEQLGADVRAFASGASVPNTRGE